MRLKSENGVSRCATHRWMGGLTVLATGSSGSTPDAESLVGVLGAFLSQAHENTGFSVLFEHCSRLWRCRKGLAPSELPGMFAPLQFKSFRPRAWNWLRMVDGGNTPAFLSVMNTCALR